MAMIKDTTTTKQPQTELDNLPNWHISNTFTGDEMIDAYLIGKKAGIQAGWDEKVQILTNQFRKNIESAGKISEELYDEALKAGVALKAIHIKAGGLTKFTTLFVAELKDYVSEEFLNIQSIARKYKGNVKNPDIYLSILFMPYSEKISKDCLLADGYFLSYDKNK